MEGKRLLRSITLKNILSFGPEGQTLDFEPLNVLIGPNGSGKSNLIDVFRLLEGLPRDMSEPLAKGGGIKEWVWKGLNSSPGFSISSEWDSNHSEQFTRHSINVNVRDSRYYVSHERIALGSQVDLPLLKYNFENAQGVFFEDESLTPGQPGHVRETRSNTIQDDQSILAQRRDADRYKEIENLWMNYTLILIYKDWTFGESAEPRKLQRADMTELFLGEGGYNLNLILRKLIRDPDKKTRLVEEFRKIYEGARDIKIKQLEEFLSLNVEEESGQLIPAIRLSDGTLRYLNLLAVLLDPHPYSLTCIEEPELGLHPDIIPTIARLLIEASQHTQLIVTTHSADLISALGDVPEAVIVCERGFDGETTMNRLDPKKMEEWLKEYTLGHLWASGEIGGNRW